MVKIKRSQDSRRRPSRPKIAVYNSQKALPLSKSSVKNLVLALLDHFSLSPEALSVHFVSKKKISALHGQFFNDPTPTDCITFPIDDAFLGEIVISPAAAIEYASKRGGDPHLELSRYLIHGFLHLLGFEDTSSAQRKQMRGQERKFLTLFKKQGLLL